jgi:2,3-bisphosphoglycerate-independent phosphoglycerate mutase
LNLRHKFVIIIPDGAADSNRERGCSPLQAAQLPGMDFIAREGVSGVVHTLYPDLPRESMVAQLGLLGWDPRTYYPCGRASAELLACADVDLARDDIAFRANLVRMIGKTLASYNAAFITSTEARPLIVRLRSRLAKEFPEFELYHQSDFRNTLVVRNADIDPRELVCPEPHENHGRDFELRRLIVATTQTATRVADRINEYLVAASGVLANESANALFPWSASRAFSLPQFHRATGFVGRVAIVGFMDFLLGIARAGGIEFFRVGNGRPNTDYVAKGNKAVELLEAGYSCVVCHINAPDEASHMGDLACKIDSLERIDRFIVGPVLRYFERHLEELGGVMIVPDHYSNIRGEVAAGKRSDIHSLHPVPFALWNNRERDLCLEFSESEAVRGRYAGTEINHLDLLPLLIHNL